MNDMDTVNDKDTAEIGILVWQALQKRLKKERAAELSSDRFTLQRDAYVRLSEDDIASDAPFLSYEYAGNSGDGDLSLYIYLFRDGLSIDVGPLNYGFDWTSFSFGQTFIHGHAQDAIPEPDADRIARNVITVIKLVLSGTILAGLNYRKGRLVAAEIFLKRGNTQPLPIGIFSSFPRLARAADSFSIRQNNLLDGQVTVPEDFPLLPPVIDGDQVIRGRSVDLVDDLEPLTKKQADDLEIQAGLHENIGKKPGTDLYKHLYSTLPFWILVVAVISVAVTLRFAPFTPAFFHSPVVFLIIALAGRYLISFAGGYWLAKRHIRVQRGEKPLTYRVERWLAARVARLRRRA